MACCCVTSTSSATSWSPLGTTESAGVVRSDSSPSRSRRPESFWNPLSARSSGSFAPNAAVPSKPLLLPAKDSPTAGIRVPISLLNILPIPRADAEIGICSLCSLSFSVNACVLLASENVGSRVLSLRLNAPGVDSERRLVIAFFARPNTLIPARPSKREFVFSCVCSIFFKTSACSLSVAILLFFFS